MNEKKDRLVMVGLFIVSVLIRMFFLFKPKDLWHDESFTILFIQKPLLFILSSNDVHPPLYYLLKPIIYFTTNELILRMISLIFFIGFFIMLYILLKKHFDFGTRWFVLSLITFSPTIIFYSLEIRNYMLGMLLVVIQIYYFFECVENDNFKHKHFIIFSILCLYTHYYTAFVLVVELIYLLRYYKDDVYNYKFIVSYIIIGILSIPLVIYFLTTLTKMQSMWFKEIDFGSFVSTTTYQFLFPEMFSSFTIYIFMIVFISLIGVYIYFPMDKKTKFFLGLFYIPVILLWIISQFTPVYHHRFFLFYVVGLYIVIAKGISLLYNSKKLLYLGIILFVLILNILFGGIFIYDSVQNKDLYKSQLELKSYLNNNKEYIFIHESTFSMSPMKVYMEDWNIKHYLINNLTRKQLFTAGGSVVEDHEIINSEILTKLKKDESNNIIFVTHNTNIRGEVINAIYNNGGLLIYER